MKTSLFDVVKSIVFLLCLNLELSFNVDFMFPSNREDEDGDEVELFELNPLFGALIVITSSEMHSNCTFGTSTYTGNLI